MASLVSPRMSTLPASLRESLEAAEMLVIDLARQVVEFEASEEELQYARRLLTEQRLLALSYMRDAEGGEVCTISTADAPVAVAGH